MAELHLFVDFEIETRLAIGLAVVGIEPAYMYKKLLMLTDFEGATRKNEVRLRIWSSKEGTGMLRDEVGFSRT
ncbi:hypothetical protein Pyn_19822 [Prunus yedoensis var. nudiflora]|uniref:Uncharacterized protein n=1 Tax=Prunus yedoensis var. nudiflora TaxID=2094558 RepID=A0A314ZWD4_PRUYE|nr:hypothetical protein Pyn_19822 [Prunus yedoensis var. nudiflora]